MFRKLWKWTKGDSLGAELIGAIANRLTYGFAGKDRSIANIENRLTDGNPNNNNLF